MRIKIFQSMSECKVEKKVNEFLSKKDIKVLEIRYKPTIFFFSVMVIYEDGDSKAYNG